MAPRRSSVADEPIVFGECIAERRYRVGRSVLLLQFGTPHRTTWGHDYSCAFRTVFRGEERVHRTFGVDALQSLLLALGMARVVLQTGWPDLRWFPGMERGNVGIARQVPDYLGLSFERELEARARRRRRRAQPIVKSSRGR